MIKKQDTESSPLQKNYLDRFYFPGQVSFSTGPIAKGVVYKVIKTLADLNIPEDYGIYAIYTRVSLIVGSNWGMAVTYDPEGKGNWLTLLNCQRQVNNERATVAQQCIIQARPGARIALANGSGIDVVTPIAVTNHDWAYWGWMKLADGEINQK